MGQPRVLYIRRAPPADANVLAKLRKWLRMPQQQDAFFEAALGSATHLTVWPHSVLARAPRRYLRRFDAIVVNAKAAGDWLDPAFVAAQLRGISAARGLFLGGAQPATMPADSVLDPFDAVYKREPFADLGRYHLSARNQRKLVPTLAGCPFGRPRGDDGFSDPYDKDYDVFFAGRVNDATDIREEVWRQVVHSELRYLGGLHPRKHVKDHVAPELQGPRIKGAGYAQAIRRSRVNLALDGYGPVTARHLELWQSKAFMLSSPAIREIWLHETPREGEAYAAFDTAEGAVDVIRYYLARPEARRAIAQGGGAFFERLYEPSRHGEQLVASLAL